MRVSFYTFLFSILIYPFCNAQKTLEAKRVSSLIEVDGHIDEEVWKDAEIATDFTTTQPEYGKTPEQNTWVRVLYDDEAIYVSALMEEVSRDSIMTELSERDNVGNTDLFSIIIDTYGNGTDGVTFVVQSTGVQYDALKSNNGGEDDSWDAVWFSGVQLSDDGWTCEMKIPYSALRFPKKESQEWVINFARRQTRKNMMSLWSPLDPEVNGVFTQSGLLVGIKDIEPPIRLSFSPYFSAYALHNKDVNSTPVNNMGFRYNGGMDVKYGINDAFTLDMTLIPDFGQVESDDNVVNLSPFEIRFDEKRPFFTEGVELFNKAGIFYTRRIGGDPLNYWAVEDEIAENEMIESNERVPQLYNTTKISGRNKKGLAIGFLNAVEAPTYATIRNTENDEVREILTQPLTNYNVTVFDQNLKNNSSVSIINTNVFRKGREFYDANVTGIEFDIKDKKQNYSIYGEGAVSVQSFAEADNNVGHKMELEFAKISGKINYWIGYSEESPDYNPNDLGFLRAPNERNFGFGGTYRIFEPFGQFNRANFWFNYNYNRVIDPDAFTGMFFNTGFWMQSKGFWNFNMWANFSPDRYDYFEPRTPGRYLKNPTFYNAGIWVGTDNRKKLRLSLFVFAYNLEEEGRWGYEIGLNPRYRFNDRLSVYLDSEYGIQYDDTGWVDFGANDEIIMGQRDRLSIENLMGFEYKFNHLMTLDTRIRHYWDRALYQTFHALEEDGTLADFDYDRNRDYEFNFFTIDMNFRWRFAPGSDLFLNWKNSIAGGHDREMIDIGDIGYFDSFGNFDNYFQNNSLSLRVVYFLDYLNLKKLM